MRKIIFIGMVLLPCMAIAGTDCRIIEYPDHFEAVCDGDSRQSPVALQNSGQEQNVASSRSSQQESPDVPPEMIVRNDLAKMHAEAWIRSRQSR